MKKDYEYLKQVHRPWYGRFKSRLSLSLVVALALTAVTVIVVLDLRRSAQTDTPQVSAAIDEEITGAMTTFNSPYFQFQDSGKWVLSKRDSTPAKFVYYKYKGLEIQHRLTIYINEVPIPLDLAVGKVLPVRIVNNTSLDVTDVAGPCVSAYKPGELHKVKTVTIQGAEMLCDPDTPQFSVVLAEVGGDYRLNFQRADDSAVQFVITYRDMRLDPSPETIRRVAGSFKAI